MFRLGVETVMAGGDSQTPFYHRKVLLLQVEAPRVL